MTYTVTSRCVRAQDIVYLSHSRNVREKTHGIRGVLGMNLVACDAPAGVLDEAPHTALRQDTSTEQWEGFWADDDRYYARCTTAAGVAWFTLDDGIETVELVSSTPLVSNPVPRVGIVRRPIVFRVGQGCIVGFRHAVKRAAPRLVVAASRARSSDISA
ncbi:MAG TPA: hypothetical protein VFA43_01005 [Gemmatimonadaceae bacterium]|nr:hypothetical protein [Gemmatimonadaceae bacterium]